MSAQRQEAKRWFVTGMVQGVGFRHFVRTNAAALNLTGYARNLSDGRVEVFATGPKDRLSDLAAALHKGAPMSHVRSVEEHAAAPENHSAFEIR